MPQSVCYLCRMRHTGCHGSCTEYLAERIIRAPTVGEQQANDYEICAKRRIYRLKELMRKRGRHID